MSPDPAERGAPAGESVGLALPLGSDFEPLVRLVLGGIGAHANMGFEAIDDLQLAVERLLAEAGGEGRINLDFELHAGGVRTRVGPLRTGAIADALQGAEPPPGELTLRRVLETVVDSFGVEAAADGALVVRLEKVARGA